MDHIIWDIAIPISHYCKWCILTDLGGNGVQVAMATSFFPPPKNVWEKLCVHFAILGRGIIAMDHVICLTRMGDVWALWQMDFALSTSPVLPRRKSLGHGHLHVPFSWKRCGGNMARPLPFFKTSNSIAYKASYQSPLPLKLHHHSSCNYYSYYSHYHKLAIYMKSIHRV